jgi:hypothetical protein
MGNGMAVKGVRILLLPDITVFGICVVWQSADFVAKCGLGYV